MGGPSKNDYKRSEDITTSQVNLGKDQLAFAKQDRDQMQAAIKPALDFNKGVTTDQKSLLIAMAPLLSQITRGAAASKESVYDAVPRGPARDLALAEVERGKNDSIAATKNNTFMTALDKLANIGSGLGSFSLQETGAGLSGLSAGMNSNNSLMQAKAAKKAAAMAPLTALAGGVGGAIGGGGLTGMFKKPAAAIAD